jgi:hypothetical protein
MADVLLGEKLITSRNPNRQTDFETKYIFEQRQVPLARDDRTHLDDRAG